MKILIAVPTFENIMPDTFKSIYDLDTSGLDCSFDFVRGYDCATARNNIVIRALDGGYDYVLMVDNDVVLPKDALKNLLEEPKMICLGYYAHRNDDNIYNRVTSVCKLGEFNYTWQYSAEEILGLRESGTYKQQIHGGGMGCALINVDLFRKLKYPWFDWVNYQEKGMMLSEDLYLCEQCKHHKVSIYMDTRVGCGHTLRHIQWPV